ncbi:hypothetical protein [Candidatus Palauibacter sp.]|uniref:hypothetical protein n=1 Tax=Candidatus Palauibacter sp. TaxID=3101350 RepID=UPI003AF2837D
MRFVMRIIVFAVVILAAFWFTTENANELVNVDLAFLRIRASLPLVVFSSILGGMGLSAAFAWRAERRATRREASRAAIVRRAPEAMHDFREDPAPAPAPAPAESRLEPAEGNPPS